MNCRTFSLFVTFCLSFSVLANQSLQAQGTETVKVSDRHIILLNPGVDALWGSYLFLVSNSASEPVAHEMTILLPKETSDWQALDNVSPDEIQLGKNGGLNLRKTFQPGDHLLSIGFKVNGSAGGANLSFNPQIPIGSLSLLINDSNIRVEGSNLSFAPQQSFQNGKRYDTYSFQGMEPGKTYEAVVKNIPEGRTTYWRLGFGVIFVLSILVGLIAWKTKPTSTAENEALAS